MNAIVDVFDMSPEDGKQGRYSPDKSIEIKKKNVPQTSGIRRFEWIC